jgi:hypothetical protein
MDMGEDNEMSEIEYKGYEIWEFENNWYFISTGNASAPYPLPTTLTGLESVKMFIDLLAFRDALQQELEDEIRAHEKIANICNRAGAHDIDGTSIGYVESLTASLSKWRAIAEELGETCRTPGTHPACIHCGYGMNNHDPCCPITRLETMKREDK